MSDRVQTLRVRTPEGVAFSYRIASPVLRSAALIIDVAAIAVASSLINALLNLLQLVAPDWGRFFAVVIFFLLSQGYRIVAEWRWRGQTLGKWTCRLRVVDARGFRLTFSQIALRNLLRFADVLPFAYGVGGAVALASRHGQRLGDLAAGTLVIWEPTESAPDLAALRSDKYNSLRSHLQAVARLRQAVGPAEARVAWQAIARRDQLENIARLELFADLAAHFKSLTPIPAEAIVGVSDEQFVRNVVDVLFLAHA